jgi:uncharacterized protein (DUF433 family)
MSQVEVVRITRNPGVCGGKPCIAGSRIRVQDVHVWHELQGLSADEIVSRYPQLSMADVYAALSYYWDHRDEIQQQMAADDELVERMKAQYGSPLREKLRGIDASDDSLPSR